MPELPEVETIVRQLRPVLSGERISLLKVCDPKLKIKAGNGLVGARLCDVVRLGKQIVFVLERPQRSKGRFYLAVHLRMTGRLLWLPKDKKVPRTFSEKHVRAVIRCRSGELLFVDPRRFGTFTLTEGLDSLLPAGIDPVSPDLTRSAFTALLSTSTQCVKPWLLRQDRLVGLGNIYACEILYGARISPFRQVKRLSAKKVSELHRETRRVLFKAIKHCGTTFSDFQNARGEFGGYQRFLKVYNREGEPCRSCRSKIKRTLQQGRSTYYCPRCQR